jgi:hypothetical protein
MTRHTYTPLNLRHIDAERRFYLGQMLAHMSAHKQWAEANMGTMSPQAYSDCAELQGIMGATVAAYLNDTAAFIAWREWEEDHTKYSRDHAVQVPPVNALVDHLSAQLHIPTAGGQTILPYRRPSWWQRAKNWLNTPIG